MKALLMILIFFPGVLSAQVELDLQLCREMAIRNSKEMEIADRQHRKAMFDTKSYRADYLPKLSAVGVGFYNQKKYNYKLKGGYLPKMCIRDSPYQLHGSTGTMAEGLE